jgi:hypothetical protein
MGRLRTPQEIERNISDAVRHAQHLAHERGESWRGEVQKPPPKKHKKTLIRGRRNINPMSDDQTA